MVPLFKQVMSSDANLHEGGAMASDAIAPPDDKDILKIDSA